MPSRYDRSDRLNEEMKHAITEILAQLKDKRLPAIISVVRVEVTRDLRYARIYVSSLGDEKVHERMMAALESAAGFVRRELGHRFKLHYTPEPQFILDNSIEYGVHIASVLNEIAPKGNAEGASAPGENAPGENAQEGNADGEE